MSPRLPPDAVHSLRAPGCGRLGLGVDWGGGCGEGRWKGPAEVGQGWGGGGDGRPAKGRAGTRPKGLRDG